MIVVALLLLFAGDIGATLTVGLGQCRGHCGCCDLNRHGAADPQTTAHHPMVAPVHQMGSGTAGGCCMPSAFSGCDQDQDDHFAILPTPALSGQLTPLNQRHGASTAVSGAPTFGGGSAPDPYAATLLSRATTIPIYLQSAVFLC